GRSPESRGSGESTPDSRVQVAAAPGRVQGESPWLGTTESKFTSRKSGCLDVIGSVVAIGDVVLVQFAVGHKIRRTVVIEDAESNQLDCTFWDHWATMWDKYAQKRNKLGHMVFILQLGKKTHCIVYARIHRLHKENGWAYTACKECNKKVDVVESKASSSSGKSKVTLYCEEHGAVHVASRYSPPFSLRPHGRTHRLSQLALEAWTPLLNCESSYSGSS
nr:nucleic acid-binding, OB-fold protein [Tanacetum cinerariifolium]